MFNRLLSQVKKKAKRHKFWMEKVTVYPYSYEINGRRYFLVDFLKMRQPTGTAIFSDKEEVALDAKKAHQRLYQFYRLMEKIQEESRMRAAVDLDFFRTPLKLMDKKSSDKLHDGYELIKSLLSYQLTYKKTYENFWAHLQELKGKRRALTEEDWVFTVETAAKLETLQEQMTKVLAENIERIRTWKGAMKEEGHWDKMTSAEQVFYLQLLETEEVIKEQAKSMKNFDYDRSLKENVAKLKLYKKKEQKEDERVLRNPS
ncbi:hypothetical protein LGQ02_00940 [Bacillus shivajii]|uniref:hypothetical protein n=1 Tax=Bacillus shivajii TaxID=1983719 RepID=UPI001CFA8ED7|nr:hypothetical protein [Bacillus shivajii]UCZ53406.1 hypothetical protein LGQ02_00940 [Bacillus shivajii]